MVRSKEDNEHGASLSYCIQTKSVLNTWVALVRQMSFTFNISHNENKTRKRKFWSIMHILMELSDVWVIFEIRMF